MCCPSRLMFWFWCWQASLGCYICPPNNAWNTGYSWVQSFILGKIYAVQAQGDGRALRSRSQSVPCSKAAGVHMLWPTHPGAQQIQKESLLRCEEDVSIKGSGEHGVQQLWTFYICCWHVEAITCCYVNIVNSHFQWWLVHRGARSAAPPLPILKIKNKNKNKKYI